MTDLNKDALDALDALDGLRAWIEAEAEDRGTADALYPPDRKCAPALALVTALRQQISAAQCCMCGKADLSTAEDGGPECELSDGRWVCSRECYDRAMITCEANQQIAAAEAAGLERAAAWLETVPQIMPNRQEFASHIRALITPEAASALAAREAAAHRAGKLEGLLEAAEVKKEPKYGDDWLGMTCAILALAECIEKGAE